MVTLQNLHYLAELPLQQPDPRQTPGQSPQAAAQKQSDSPHRYHLQAEVTGLGPGQVPVLGPAYEPNCFITEDSASVPPNIWELMVYRGDLVYLHHGIYTHRTTQITPLFKAQSLALISPADYLYRLRFSRHAAAWILGYLDTLPETRVDVDYDRNRRLNIPRTYRSSFAAHVATLNPQDTMSLGPITLTTPLKTALDLVTYCKDDDANNAIVNILTAPGNRATPASFLEAVATSPAVRESAYRRAQFLVDIATIKAT